MIAKSLKLAVLISGIILLSTPIAYAKGFSASVSRSSISTTRSFSSSPTKSYSRTAVKSPAMPYKASKVNKPIKRKTKAVEYDYFPLRDCTRIREPVNGYRCIDRD